MKYMTLEKNIHCKYRFPLYYKESAIFSDEGSTLNRFRLVLIDRGAVFINIDGCQTSFSSPAILCLSETDNLQLKPFTDIHTKSIYFHPSIVNTNFDFHNIRNKPKSFSYTEAQDCYLLYPFFKRNPGYNGQLAVGPNTFQLINKLFQDIKHELDSQKDIAESYRFRFLFIELLILTTRLYDNKEETIQFDASGIPHCISQIINYLQTNYQRKITIGELTKIFNINRTTLSRQFYEATKSSVIDYLIKYRVKVASTLLKDTRLSISEIRERVGVNDTTCFWRIFKKYTGHSPSVYRSKYSGIRK